MISRGNLIIAVARRLRGNLPTVRFNHFVSVWPEDLAYFIADNLCKNPELDLKAKTASGVAALGTNQVNPLQKEVTRE